MALADDHDRPAVEAGDFLRAQVDAERQALWLVARSDVQASLNQLAADWREGKAGFLSETYAQLPASIQEVVLPVALQVVNGDPRRPGVIEISAGPHHWAGTDIPGGRAGASTVPISSILHLGFKPGIAEFVRRDTKDLRGAPVWRSERWADRA